MLGAVARSARTRAPVQHFSVAARAAAATLPGLEAAALRRAVRQYSSSFVARQTAGGSGDASSAKPGAEQAVGEEGEQAKKPEGEEEFSDEAYYADEPLAARISRYIWTTVKYSAGIGVVGLVFYAGYTIVVTLLPGGSSANAIMRHAGDVLRADPEIHAVFGSSLKAYGEDFGARNEGRRYFVPEYQYTDDWDGQAYTRVRFSIEGERGRKGVVWAEVRAGTYDFRYLIVMAKDKSRVWTVTDARRPPPTLEDRRARLSTVLADNGWVFYADGEGDERGQAEEVGSDYWLKVRHVRCDLTPGVCDAAGVTGRPAWGTHRAGEVLKGARSLGELEELTRDVAHKKKSWWWPF